MSLVSVIIPIHDAERTLSQTLASISTQTHTNLEVCVCDDGSTDKSMEVLHQWAALHSNIPLKCYVKKSPTRALGPGYARNKAASLANTDSTHFCFLDSDDVMAPTRIAQQLEASQTHPGALIGGGFTREPADATPKYTAWANTMTQEELVTQSWRECTLIQPTWFMEAALFRSLGGYDEVGPVLWEEEDGREIELEKGGYKSSSSSNGGGGVPPYAFPSLLLDPTTSAESESGFGGGEWEKASKFPRHPSILSRPPLKFRPECLSGDGMPPPLPSHFTPYPEDPIFFHRHLHAHAQSQISSPKGESSCGLELEKTPPLFRVPSPPPLLLYRFSTTSLTWRVSRQVLLKVKAALFEERVLLMPQETQTPWMIWGAGRDGKAFFNALSPAARALLIGWIEVDPGKVGQVYPIPIRIRPKHKKGGGNGSGGGGIGKGKREREGEAGVADDGSGSGGVGGDKEEEKEEGIKGGPPPWHKPLPIHHWRELLAVKGGGGGGGEGGEACIPPQALLGSNVKIIVCVAQDTGGGELAANIECVSKARVEGGFSPLVEGKTLFYTC